MHTSFLTPIRLLAAMVISAAISGTALAANDFQAGDEFVVARPAAPLMRGTRTLGWLPQGQRLTALRTEGDWVGTKAVVGGRAIGGWLYRPHVLTPSRYAQQRTARRRFSYQAGEAGESDYVYPSRPYYPGGNSGSILNRRLIMGYTPYGPAYWRADRKIVGY